MRLSPVISALAAIVAVGAGCPTVDLGETPIAPGACRPDPTFFRERIWPEYIAPPDPEKSCVANSGCHDQKDGRSAFRVSTQEPIDFMANYVAVTRFLNCGTPEASSALTKPLSGINSHGGGDQFAPGSPSEQVFLEWLNL